MKNFIKSVKHPAKTLGLTLGLALVFISCENEEILTEQNDLFLTTESDNAHRIKKQDLQVETLTTLDGFGYDGVTADQKGNVYVSEFGAFEGSGGAGTRIFKVTKNKEVSEFATGLSGPLGSVFDRRGNLFVCQTGASPDSGEIIKIKPDGTQSVFATIEGFPSGLAIDLFGNIYVANFANPTVFKVNKWGKVTEFATDSRLAGTVGIDFDYRGNLILGNYGTADILSVSRKGDVSLLANIPNIVVNGAGIGGIEVVGTHIYATGISVNQIFKISKKGEVETFAGNGENASNDGLLNEASFITPNRIEFDWKSKSLIISQYLNSDLRKIKLY